VELVGQSARTTALNLVALGSGFVTSVALSRLLGTRGYGAYVYVISWPTLLAVAAQRGYTQLLVREVAARSVRGEWELVASVIRRSFRVVLASSAALVAITALVGWRFVGHGQPILRQAFFVGLFLVPALALITQREAILRGFGHVPLGRVPETVAQPTVLLSGLLLLRVVWPTPLDAQDAVVVTVVAALAAVALGSYFVRRVLPPQVRTSSGRATEERRAWARSARSLLAVSGLSILNLQIGILVVGAMETVDDAGMFSAALRSSIFVGFLSTAAQYPLAPALARLHASDQRARLQSLIFKATRGVFVASVPIVIGLWVFAGLLLSVFGDGFGEGTPLLRILILGELVNIATGFGGQLLLYAGEERRLFAASAWLAGSKALLMVALTEMFGVTGAAISQAIGVGVQNLLFAWIAWRRLGLYTPAVAGRRFLAASRAQVLPQPR